MKLQKNAYQAVLLGSVCSASYFAVYVVRNILGAVSPQMIEQGVFTTENIGTLSSIYFITYAVGQLLNGMMGDKIKSKYMISFGLMIAGVCNTLFTNLWEYPIAAYISYGMCGFCLSMIYAPMTKTVAENTEPIYATRCSLGYTFASFLGTPIAGILAAVLVWQGVFFVGSATLVIMGCVSFALFTVFDKKGIIRYNQYKRQKGTGNGIKVLISHRIIQFTLVAILTGIVRTTVVFWLPTYFVQYLGISAEKAALIFTVITFLRTFSSIAAIILYEKLRYNMELALLISFSLSALCFILAFFVAYPVLNIIFIGLAIFASGCASSLLWSRYCPSLRDTGMVSSATGFLDFMSYVAASISSTVFANAVSVIGWGNLILVWFGLKFLGIIVVLFSKRPTEKT